MTSRTWRCMVATTVALCIAVTGARQSRVVHLDELDLRDVSQSWGQPHARRSVEDNPLKLGGKEYARGLGTHAASFAMIDLGGQVDRFDAVVGVDDEASPRGSIVFRIVVDGKTAYDSGIIRRSDPPKDVRVENLAGAKLMELHVTDSGDGEHSDHADWADARFTMAASAPVDAKPRIFNPISNEQPRIASTVAPPEPQIHGARVVGTTPGRPFLFLVPATGEQPLKFSAEGLPDGLSIDGASGIISGTVRSPGTSDVIVNVTNARGRASRKLRIAAGDHWLALTPPMGWNSWNVWGTAVDADKIRAAADALVASGLAAHGYAYVNIDDAWQGTRDANGEIRPNEKFGDIKALADYVHAKGLKLGIYTSPGPKTCAGLEGSLGHEEQDAKTWARWRIDYVKHDWCSCTSQDLREPYAVMRRALDAADRDIVYSLCQYGMGDVWTWGASEPIGANLWRTTGDITDTWASLADIGFRQHALSPHVGPGHWNDPDMLVVGKVGWGPKVRASRLRPVEQQTHITLWAMCAAPLLTGCDLSQLDDFTRDLLCNDEVLDVDQDPLGKAARRVSKDGDAEVWARPLFDGTVAVAMFNRGWTERTVKTEFVGLELHGAQPVRDLWTREDLGSFDDQVERRVQAHGSALLKIGRPARSE